MEATGAGFANTWKAQSSCQDKLDWLDDPCSLNIESGEAQPRGACGAPRGTWHAGGGRWRPGGQPIHLLLSATWLVYGGPWWLSAKRHSKGARLLVNHWVVAPVLGLVWCHDRMPSHPPCCPPRLGRSSEGRRWVSLLTRGVVLHGAGGAWVARQLGSGDLLEGSAPTEALTPSPANYAEHWCSLLKKAETPFGRCHSAVDPSDYYKVGGIRMCTPHHLIRASKVCSVPGLSLTLPAGLPLEAAGRVCASTRVCVCMRVCAPCRDVSLCVNVHRCLSVHTCVCRWVSVPTLFPPSLPASFAPRGANTTRVTARTARAACVPRCPLTPAPVPLRASCCGAGGSKSAVSAILCGVRCAPWREGSAHRGSPLLLFARGLQRGGTPVGSRGPLGWAGRCPSWTERGLGWPAGRGAGGRPSTPHADPSALRR